MSERTYLFVRHAEALHQSRAPLPSSYVPGSDWPLTERGERQARAVAPSIRAARVERIVSSELLRARQTAAIVADAIGVAAGEAWGELDEIAPRVLRTSTVRRPEWLDGILGAWRVRRHGRGRDGSREIAAVEERVRGVLARLDAMPERRIAIVGHGYWILLMALIVPGPFRLRFIDNCSVTRVDADGSGEHRLIEFARRAQVQ